MPTNQNIAKKTEAEIIEILREAAMYGKLEKVPKAYLKEKYLAAKDESDRNILSLAAKMGKLNMVPSHLLKQNLLTVPDRNGNTPLHLSAIQNELAFLPKEVFTEENLLIHNSCKETVAHIAAENLEIKFIPKELLTDTVILKEDRLGLNVLDHIHTGFKMTDYSNTKKETWTYEAKYIIKRLSDKALRKLIKKNKESFVEEINEELNIRKLKKEISENEFCEI